MSKEYEAVIGLEVHVELNTKTKIFCGCSTAFGGSPNINVCPVCSGMPGSLPVLNRAVVDKAISIGLATNCNITRNSKFDRKNYFYPDNPQNYQISQLYYPICRDGKIEIETENGKKFVRIHEMHMEEDAGKLIHNAFTGETYVDFNRSGVPLVEIVSEPDMRSADEVLAYLDKLRLTIQYLGASDCKLNEGSMRVDVNMSLREKGTEKFGTRTETKNLNSFKAIKRCIENEFERQAAHRKEHIRAEQESGELDRYYADIEAAIQGAGVVIESAGHDPGTDRGSVIPSGTAGNREIQDPGGNGENIDAFLSELDAAIRSAGNAIDNGTAQRRAVLRAESESKDRERERRSKERQGPADPGIAGPAAAGKRRSKRRER